ncbi:hypothetical protein B566_EDAN013817 [Ephemera danica]|nr:hypothetical protein B566_EDAN013817 [Ephemera danica]
MLAFAVLCTASLAFVSGQGYGFPPVASRVPIGPAPLPSAPAGPAPLPSRPAGPAPLPSAGYPLQQVAGWTYLNFAGVNPESHIKENGVFTGIQVTPDRIFLSLPRSRDGTPATLTWIPNTGTPSINQPLNPYPDWSWQQGHLDNCNGLVSVFRSRIDSCGRLWALDSGVLTPLDGNPMRACPPRLVAFDLRTNLAVRSVTFPPEVLRNRSLLTTLVLDEAPFSGNCENMFIYISDTSSPGLIVYDFARDLTWRFEDESLTPDQNQATYNIAGESFTLADGVVGMTISNLGPQRMLFYHPLARRTIFALPVDALKNPQTSRLPVISIGEKTSQGAGMISDAQGEIYFSPLTETAVASWNPNTGMQRILAVDPVQLQFVSDFFVDSDGSIWLITNRFQSFFQRTYDPRGINLRVLRIPYAANGAQFTSFNPINSYNFNRIVRNTNETSNF